MRLFKASKRRVKEGKRYIMIRFFFLSPLCVAVLFFQISRSYKAVCYLSVGSIEWHRITKAVGCVRASLFSAKKLPCLFPSCIFHYFRYCFEEKMIAFIWAHLFLWERSPSLKHIYTIWSICIYVKKFAIHLGPLFWLSITHLSFLMGDWTVETIDDD